MTTYQADRRWIMSPWFDLCFVVNVWWVVLVLIPEPSSQVTNDSMMTFWQLYFITTPHRWLTLFLVATDPDRRQGRSKLFLTLAIFAAIVVMGVWRFGGGLKCLIVVDYVWNAWHFGSQNAGILRIYSRKAGGGRPRMESNIPRFFVMYVALRAATQLNGWLEANDAIRQVVGWIDIVFLAAPLSLIFMELLDSPQNRPGKVLYLISVYMIYGSFLIAIMTAAYRWLVPLAVATAAFHAIEYMAIVTFYANRRKATGSDGLFKKMAKNWLQILFGYIVLAGTISSFMNLFNANRTFPFWFWEISYHDVFVGVNIWAAYLHYAYDGMIWKLRRPETAKTLDVELPETANT